MKQSEADLTVREVFDSFSKQEKKILYKFISGYCPIKVSELQLYYSMSPIKQKVFNYIFG